MLVAEALGVGVGQGQIPCPKMRPRVRHLLKPDVYLDGDGERVQFAVVRVAELTTELFVQLKALARERPHLKTVTPVLRQEPTCKEGLFTNPSFDFSIFCWENSGQHTRGMRKQKQPLAL